MIEQQDEQPRHRSAVSKAVDREQNCPLAAEPSAPTIADALGGKHEDTAGSNDREIPEKIDGAVFSETEFGYGSAFMNFGNFSETPASPASGAFVSRYENSWLGGFFADGAPWPGANTEAPPARMSFSGLSGFSSPASEPTDWSGTPLSSSKRPWAAAFPEDPAEPAGPKKSARTSGGDKEDQRPLACPFQKRFPLKHQKCLKYELHRVKDVKQHIFRCHMQPDYYCARCYVVFDSSAQRDEHTRLATCDVQPIPAFEGISVRQRVDLRRLSNRQLSVEDQWLEIWKMLFPAEPKPQSSYRGTQLEQMAPLLRDLWKSKRSDILTQMLPQDRAAETMIQPLVEEVMKAFLDQLEVETGTLLPKDES